MKRIKKVTIVYEDDTLSEIEFSREEHFRLHLSNLFYEDKNEQTFGVVKKPTGERVLKLVVGPETLIEDLFVNMNFDDQNELISFGEFIRDSLAGEDWFLLNKTVEQLFQEFKKKQNKRMEILMPEKINMEIPDIFSDNDYESQLIIKIQEKLKSPCSVCQNGKLKLTHDIMAENALCITCDNCNTVYKL